jgi:hypothetical protein
MGGEVVQVVECLPSKCEAMNLKPSTIIAYCFIPLVSLPVTIERLIWDNSHIF